MTEKLNILSNVRQLKISLKLHAQVGKNTSDPFKLVCILCLLAPSAKKSGDEDHDELTADTKLLPYFI